MKQTDQQQILNGLRQPQKRISSKYFYDDKGSMIFQEIMNMPEYYLTNCELEIFKEQSNQILESLDVSRSLNVVEFGAGDGSKTIELLKAMLAKELQVTYMPIDISLEAVQRLTQRCQTQLPKLSVKPVVGDYFALLKDPPWNGVANNLYLFLGSNIGNYDAQSTLDLLKLFNHSMKKGDALLLGVDLQKDPKIISQAYDDPHGITSRFNLNLLERLNREMEANFDLQAFGFVCEYNPKNGEVRSYLESKKQQEVVIANQAIAFKQGERIWTELSKKYTLLQLEQIAQQCGFEPREHFLDKRGYFTNSLWIKTA